MTDQRTAWGWGLASVDAAGNTLDVWYPELKLGEAPEEVARPNHNFRNLAHEGADARGVRRIPVFTVSKLDEPIEDAADAYLRLHLLSMRLAKPNTLNLDGIFAALNNVVWTNYGPFAVEDFALRKLDVMAAAKPAGARGGTVARARGLSSEEAEKFLHITIQPEKDVVLILTAAAQKQSIMKAICNEAFARTGERGIAFSVPVSDVTGLDLARLAGQAGQAE